MVKVLKHLMVPYSQWYQIKPLVFQPRSKIILHNDFHVSFRVIINHYVFSKKVRESALFCLWFISQGVAWTFYAFVNETTQGNMVRFPLDVLAHQ